MPDRIFLPPLWGKVDGDAKRRQTEGGYRRETPPFRLPRIKSGVGTFPHKGGRKKAGGDVRACAFAKASAHRPT